MGFSFKPAESHKQEKEHNLKVCLVASAGGHLSQLLKLADSWTGYRTFCISTSSVVGEKLQKYGSVFIVGECNRQHPLDVLKVLSRSTKIIFQQRPEVVISTGAGVGCIVCFLAKLLGAKIIWIDSIANVERLSLSGRMVRIIADMFFVQWPQLAARYKNVQFGGAIV